ncbi:MAG: hypothetical protein ACFFD4_12705 [Candidatus Odinarchaeota archaeon]
MAKALQETGFLEDFFGYHEDARSFHLKKASISWELEWIFPVMFDNLPPHFQEMGELTLYAFALVSFPLPILIAIITNNLIFLSVLVCLVFFLLTMGFRAAGKLIREYREFKNVQNILVTRQQEKLLHLMVKEKTDQLLIHVNQENLKRLKSEKAFQWPSL